MPHHHLLRSSILALMAFVCLSCSNRGPTALDRSLLEYDQGQWIISAMWARKALHETHTHDEAAYLLGLCEYRLRHVEKAENWFLEASKSSDEEVRGRAYAMLGIIASSDGDYITAATAFEHAAGDLEGNDRTLASQWEKATKKGTIVANSEVPIGFTLQFGAYQELENAKAAAAKLDANFNMAGLGNAAIVKEVTQVGRVLFTVQAGSFNSRAAASRYRTRNALPQCIVTAIQ